MGKECCLSPEMIQLGGQREIELNDTQELSEGGFHDKVFR